MIGALREDRAARLRLRRRRGNAARAVGFHQRAPVGLLVVRHAHHEDLHVEPEQRAGERERAAPLAGAGLGDELLHARLLVVERLRDRRVGLVAARGRDAFVLVVDARRRLQHLLEPARAVQRRRPPLPVDVAHRSGDLDLALGRSPPAGSAPSGTAARDRRDRPASCVPGCSTGGSGFGRSACEVVPDLGNPRFLEDVLDGVVHGLPFLERRPCAARCLIRSADFRIRRAFAVDSDQAAAWRSTHAAKVAMNLVMSSRVRSSVMPPLSSNSLPAFAM